MPYKAVPGYKYDEETAKRLWMTSEVWTGLVDAEKIDSYTNKTSQKLYQ